MPRIGIFELLVRLSEFSAKVYPFTSFFGKGMPALFQDAVMFSKNGSKEVTIPEELLKKGTPVLISGYFRPNTTRKTVSPTPVPIWS